MAEIESSDQISSTETSESTVRNRLDNLSFSIWPPSQRTRDAVMKRLIETLSSDSILSKRYGVIPRDEASDAARRIEEEAYGVAEASASAEEDGIEILQVYSKEISRRVLDAVKSRSGSVIDAAAPAEPALNVEENDPAASEEEVSSAVEN